jgi:hypothetical protein
MSTGPDDPNIRTIALRMRDGRESPLDDGILQWMLARSSTVRAVDPPFNVAGILAAHPWPAWSGSRWLLIRALGLWP